MTIKWLALCLITGGLASLGGAYVLDFDTWLPTDLILGCGGIIAFGIGLILISRLGRS